MDSNNSGSYSPVRDSQQTCRWRFRCLLSPGSTQLTATSLTPTLQPPPRTSSGPNLHVTALPGRALSTDSSPNTFSTLNCPHSPTLKNRSVRMTR